MFGRWHRSDGICLAGCLVCPRSEEDVGSLSTPLLLLVFVAGAIATWVAGTALSKTTDVIDRRFNLGEALGDDDVDAYLVVKPSV